MQLLSHSLLKKNKKKFSIEKFLTVGVIVEITIVNESIERFHRAVKDILTENACFWIINISCVVDGREVFKGDI